MVKPKLFANFREYSSSCEFAFDLFLESEPNNYTTKEIKVSLQPTESLGTLIEGLKIEVSKSLTGCTDVSEKPALASPEFSALSEAQGDSNDKSHEVVVDNIDLVFKRGNKIVKSDVMLKSFLKSIHNNVYFEIFGKEYFVMLNAPLIKQMKLPVILYATFPIQPYKFHTVFVNKHRSQFFWYRSRDKNVWQRVGKGFKYHVNEDDIGHYLKFVCSPYTSANIKGKTAEVISDSVVEKIGDLPICPFHDRHVFTKSKANDNEFRFVTYNTLADKYVFVDEYSYCSPQVLAIDYRKQLIFSEIKGYNSDVVCLQEIDHFVYDLYFKEKFSELGYNSIYNKKGNLLPEGLLTVYARDKFKAIDRIHIVLSKVISTSKLFLNLWQLVTKNKELKELFLKQHTSLQVTVLKTNLRNKYLIVANTHLFYHPEADHIRLIQICLILIFLKNLKRRFSQNGGEVSVVMCGDFNSHPHKSLYEFMMKGCLNPEHADCLKICPNSDALIYHDFVFESACGTPKYTNYTPDFKACLDYIFIESNQMEVLKQVPLTDETVLSNYEGLPNEVFPSDHLALVVDLKFKY